MPALLIKTSRRVSERLNVAAASAILANDVRSRGRWMTSQALGTAVLTSEIAEEAFDAFLQAQGR